MQTETLAQEDHESIEAILQMYDRYIIALAHQLASRYPIDVYPAVPDMDIDEIIQRTRIKFWQALEKRLISYPYAYIKAIIQSEFIDKVRRQKFDVSLPGDEDSNSTTGTLLNKWISNPAEDVDQHIDMVARLNDVVQAVLELPPRQQLAMICCLKERVDDYVQLVRAFQSYKMDIEPIQWPTRKAEKLLLQASLACARKKLILRFKV